MIIDNIVCSESVKMDLTGFDIDYVELEWYEVSKKILHKVSKKGIEVGMKLNIDSPLKHGDILHLEGNQALLVEAPECDCIALKPQTLEMMGRACYEMGNRHAPLFYQKERLLTPYDPPLLEALKKCGFEAYRCQDRLISPLSRQTGGHTHSHSHGHDHGHEQGHEHEPQNSYSGAHLPPKEHEHNHSREQLCRQEL